MYYVFIYILMSCAPPSIPLKDDVAKAGDSHKMSKSGISEREVKR